MKYKILVSDVINQNQSYTGKEIYDMIIARKKSKFDSSLADELYNKYFSKNSEYTVKMNHNYFIRKKGREIYLARDKENL